ncbi:MAG TPA: homogentisate 1,2-dioxygenase, partial [Cryomorphaceae bacterium]|nr:homogentisate 1,2-dioxygenase [Cryomorphaceae bacterium]
MPFYHKLGTIPHKRHTTFKKPDGGYYYEQLFGTEGFSGMASLLYHVHRPTQVKEILGSRDVSPKIAVEKNITSRMLQGWNVKPAKDYLDSRIPVLVNNDLHISLAAPQESQKDYFYKNADADEMIFVHKGSGTLRTFLGNIPFGYGDYLVVPRGMIYQIEFDKEDNRLFIVDSFSPIYTPKRYRNHFGQLLEHSPFCERDLRAPQDLETHDEKGDFHLKIRT